MTKECYYKKSKGITSVKIICITLQEYFFVPLSHRAKGLVCLCFRT